MSLEKIRTGESTIDLTSAASWDGTGESFRIRLMRFKMAAEILGKIKDPNASWTRTPISMTVILDMRTI
jgi:hypothetical protein